VTPAVSLLGRKAGNAGLLPSLGIRSEVIIQNLLLQSALIHLQKATWVLTPHFIYQSTNR